MTRVLLEVRDIDIQRGGLPIIEGVSLTVKSGSITALLGANGAGKTTLIEGICGHIRLARGSILLDGVDVSKQRPVNRARLGLATVEQGRTVFKAMTTGDNLRIVASNTDVVKRAIDLFPELAARVNVRAGLLSGGEQQMLALARALVTSPKVLVIDEMSLGLAPVVVSRLLPLIKEVAVSEDMGVLLVEQFALLALDACDHAYVLRKGQLSYDGPGTILRQDADRLGQAYFGRADESPVAAIG
jgi:branched-chain amino acid transport system ATP-binding protein